MAAKRDTIRYFEKQLLVKALVAGKTWDEAKELLPDVDPAALDRGFKDWAEREAAVTPAEIEPAPVSPAMVAAPVEPAPLKKREKKAAAQKTHQ